MMKKIGIIAAFVLTLAACSTIDCSFNNRAVATYKLAGDVKKLTNPLTVVADLGDGNDSVLLNQVTEVDSFFLPMSYTRKEDVLHFKLVVGTDTLADKVVIGKDDYPRFESVDCNPIIFHSITKVEHTRNIIDSIVINNKNVTNGIAKSNFRIYFKNLIH